MLRIDNSVGFLGFAFQAKIHISLKNYKETSIGHIVIIPILVAFTISFGERTLKLILLSYKKKSDEVGHE